MTGSSEPLKKVHVLHPGLHAPLGPFPRAGHIATLLRADEAERTFPPGELAA